MHAKYPFNIENYKFSYSSITQITSIQMIRTMMKYCYTLLSTYYVPGSVTVLCASHTFCHLILTWSMDRR